MGTIESLLGLENIKPEDMVSIKQQLQEINDAIRGGLRSANLKEYRNTYVINAQDSLDASYPMYVHFNIIPEMVKIVSINISFWFQNFRAYATAASSGGAVTSASGGGETPTSSSGGAQTSSAGGAQSSSEVTPGGGACTTSANGGTTHTHDVPNHSHTAHSHTVVDHSHTVADHTHTVTVSAHTHTGGAHTHGITYGIYEDSTSPTVMFYVSRDNGLTYSLPVGSYTADHENLDITNMIDTVGGKLIKFTSNARTRLSIQITIKLDISVR